jgi:hypothetical protein
LRFPQITIKLTRQIAATGAGLGAFGKSKSKLLLGSKKMRQTTIVVLSIFVAAFFTMSAWAQEPADTLKVDYFSNANTSGAPDGTLRIDYPGTVAQVSDGVKATAVPNICAYIFVFDVQQELSECCACLQTPDGLQTFSINNNLTNNPLTGVTLHTGVIKILSVAPVSNTCPLSSGAGYITPALRAWTTHIQNSHFTITETPSQDATLSVTEANRLGSECAAIVEVGSGAGICSCGTGD